MKIRAGFVSNSSSTSFLVIAKNDLNPADFLELMGVDLNSPIADLFSQFYQDVIDNTEVTVDFKTTRKNASVKSWFTDERLSPHMLKKLEEAREHGLKAYYGHLNSDTSMIQTFFCTDSIEAENEKIYFNGLQNVW